MYQNETKIGSMKTCILKHFWNKYEIPKQSLIPNLREQEQTYIAKRIYNIKSRIKRELGDMQNNW